KTAQIATLLGATVISHPWDGYGAQKNFGAEKATHDWMLFLDADERVSKELQEAINQMPESADKNVYWITIEDIFLGRRMKHLVGHNPRLIKKGTAQWSSTQVHEQMIYTATSNAAKYKDGISSELNFPIIHESYTSVSDYLKKMHKYTSLDAQDMYGRGTHRSGRSVKKSFILPYALAVRQAVKMLFYKKGILDSWQGIMWSMLSAYYEFEMGKKYLKLCHSGPRAGIQTGDVDSGSSPE
ncbi:MAG: glycosyltransferase family 2 protein, partial [Patescibacteria group bacterium]